MSDHLFELYMVRVYTNQIIIYKHIYVAIKLTVAHKKMIVNLHVIFNLESNVNRD